MSLTRGTSRTAAIGGLLAVPWPLPHLAFVPSLFQFQEFAQQLLLARSDRLRYLH
ncbi:MAG: hypothetical protein GX422_01200, partial [Deltaproteobacteria bacterium]|nr:hypothetical protein [Deltaproteobacteria bacterium]